LSRLMAYSTCITLMRMFLLLSIISFQSALATAFGASFLP